METIQAIQCPNCGKVMECQTGLNDKTIVPHDGALSICIVCGTVSMFDSSTAAGVRHMTNDEGETAFKDPDVLKAVYVMTLMRSTGQLPATHQMQKSKDLMEQQDLDELEDGSIIFDWRKQILVKNEAGWLMYADHSIDPVEVTLPARMIFSGSNEGWGSDAT